MPFKSKAQQRYLYAREPEVAKRWQAEYGNPKRKRIRKKKRPRSKT